MSPMRLYPTLHLDQKSGQVNLLRDADSTVLAEKDSHDHSATA